MNVRASFFGNVLDDDVLDENAVVYLDRTRGLGKGVMQAAMGLRCCYG